MDLVDRRATDEPGADAVDLFCYQAEEMDPGRCARRWAGWICSFLPGGIGEHSVEVRGDLRGAGVFADSVGFKGAMKQAGISFQQMRARSFVRIIPDGRGECDCTGSLRNRDEKIAFPP